MWAWLSTTASTLLGSKGKFRFRSIDSSRLPWYKPHSSKRRCPFTSKRYIEPVVVRVAPRKCNRMGRKMASSPVEGKPRRWDSDALGIGRCGRSELGVLAGKPESMVLAGKRPPGCHAPLTILQDVAKLHGTMIGSAA